MHMEELEEYCYEDYATLEKILGSSLIYGQKQQVRQELFDPSKGSMILLIIPGGVEHQLLVLTM